MLKLSKPVLYMLLTTLVVAVYLIATPPAPTHHTKLPKPIVTVKATDAQFQPEDYTAHFAPTVLVTRNAFQPLVMRKSNLLAQQLAAAGNIPAEFAGGDPNWICTGSAQVDGVLQGLIEKKTTSDGVFLKQGDHWKNCVVSQVMEDSVVLVGPGGEAKTIHVKQDEASGEELDAGNNPVQPQLNGPIGGGPQVSGGQVTQVPALPAPTQTIQADDNAG
jgi:hypothetical protein